MSKTKKFPLDTSPPLNTPLEAGHRLKKRFIKGCKMKKKSI